MSTIGKKIRAACNITAFVSHPFGLEIERGGLRGVIIAAIVAAKASPVIRIMLPGTFILTASPLRHPSCHAMDRHNEILDHGHLAQPQKIGSHAASCLSPWLIFYSRCSKA
jgi:hypothetical protein